MFLPSDIIELIVKYTNEEANRNIQNSSYLSQEWSDIGQEELYAYIGLIFAGAHRSNDVDLRDLWSETRGAAIFRATMGRQRFELITRFLRFDEKQSRDERKRNDKLAAIRTVWNTFLQRCHNSYIPGYSVTVDEQIIPFRWRAPFKVYMRSKPDR